MFTKIIQTLNLLKYVKAQTERWLADTYICFSHPVLCHLQLYVWIVFAGFWSKLWEIVVRNDGSWQVFIFGKVLLGLGCVFAFTNSLDLIYTVFIRGQIEFSSRCRELRRQWVMLALKLRRRAELLNGSSHNGYNVWHAERLKVDWSLASIFVCLIRFYPGGGGRGCKGAYPLSTFT